MTDSATLCKCEELTTGSVRQLLAANPDTGTASALKLLSRAGMGLCQGRYCHYGVTRLLASHHDVPEASVGGFTSRFPAIPVSIERLIACETEDEPSDVRAPAETAS